MWRGLGLAVCGVMLGAATLPAHHSIVGVYDSANQVSIDGTVEQFHFVNPHPFVTVIVTGEKGRRVEWRLEMDNRFELEAIGMTSRTLMRGDRIVASGSRGRNNANSLYVLRLDRAVDGFWYEQVGTTPRTGNRSKG